MYYSIYQSPIGLYTIASDGTNLTGIWLDGQKYHGNTIFKNMTEKNDLPIFDETKKWLNRYFAGKKPEISELPLAPIGGEFRQKVWTILREISFGKIITYGEIAKKLATESGKKSISSQAVGGAVGRNPISIVIPCHRVIGSNGSLTGYAGGIDVKIKLLEMEGTDTSRMFVPARSTAI